MRTAKTILTVIQERGKQKKLIERVYKLLFNRELYLNAYAKLYPNNGAMTKGVTDETVDGMSIQKIDRMIEILREEKYQWKPARREYIKKKNGKKRPLGIPVWGDKVLQEVMRQILEAYYEPQFSEHSHGFYVQTEGVIQHYKKYRYGKELVGLLKEIFLNTLIQSTIKFYWKYLQEISMMEDLSVWYRICYEAGILGRMEIQSDNQRCASERSYRVRSG